jgi:putative (di)nucleoside polyphosphate hydrolase
MKTLKIAVGTTSEQKIGYLKEILDEIGINVEIIPTEAKSGVSDQPITEEETQTGSINRAKVAFESVEDADFGIGIEVGYHKNKDENFEMFCCTSIFGKGEAIASCFSTKFLLPDFHQQILKENKYLGEYVHKYKEEIDEPIINYTRELVRGRKPLIVEATRNVLLQFLELHATVSHLLKSDSLGYRDKSLGIIVDKDKNFLLVQLHSYGENDWNFPGGGIEDGETPEEALLRELSEELGSKKFKILAKSKKQIEYDWPDFIIVKDIKKRNGKTFRGQRQNIFLVEFSGDKGEINPDPVEIRHIKWVRKNELKDYLNFPSQKELADEVLKELLPEL